MSTELRCANKLFGLMLDDDNIEFKCDSRFCGAGGGWTVLHQINIHTGEVTTSRFKNPPTPQERKAAR